MSGILKRSYRHPFILGIASILAAACGATAQTPLADLPPVAPVMDCAQLQRADFSAAIESPMKITSATAVANGQPAPYCRVLGYVSPQVEFEVRLPLSGWTQRFVQTGCGGLCGNTNVRVGNDAGCAPTQRGEVAVASTNMGHRASGDGMWAAEDPQLRIDFAYRGVHVTALAAKALIEKFYGQKPKFSYFAGCSDGGREALMEAQRYPEDFNGITAGAPAMNFITQNTFYHGWNARSNTGADGQAILTADKLLVLHAAAVANCDEADGLKDGQISDPRACRFDPAVTACKPGQDAATCLTAAQVDTARKLYQGAHDASGKQLVISGPQVGSELAWRGVYVPNGPGQGIMSEQISLDVIKYMAMPKNPPATYKLADFRFDQAMFDLIKPMHAIFDATDPDLAPFASAGGKLILWHGWSDPHISPLNTIAYYTAMRGLMGEDKVRGFARLFLFPGGYHCGGGDGPFNMDMMSAIMGWVERGGAPDKIMAAHTTGAESPGARRAPAAAAGPGPGGPGGPDGPPGGFQAAAQNPTREAPGLLPGTPGKVDRTRPVFAYPMVAVYTGSGSIDDAANFVAASPKTAQPEKFDWLGASFFTPHYEQWCGWSGMSFSCKSTR